MAEKLLANMVIESYRSRWRDRRPGPRRSGGLDHRRRPGLRPGLRCLTAQLRGRPNLETYGGRDPLLDNYNDGAALSLYAVTKPGHPAYPAIVKRKLNGAAPVETSACGYGDKAGFDGLMRDIDILNAGVRKNYGG